MNTVMTRQRMPDGLSFRFVKISLTTCRTENTTFDRSFCCETGRSRKIVSSGNRRPFNQQTVTNQRFANRENRQRAPITEWHYGGWHAIVGKTSKSGRRGIQSPKQALRLISPAKLIRIARKSLGLTGSGDGKLATVRLPSYSGVLAAPPTFMVALSLLPRDRNDLLMAELLPRRFSVFKRLLRMAPLCVVPLACMIMFGLTGAGDKSLSEGDFGLILLQPDQFRLELERNGLVEPAESDVVRSACYWKTPILSIVPEGTWVQEGDVVCVLDASNVQEYARSREVILIRYRGLLDNALHDEKMLSTDSERALSAAQFKYTQAAESLRTYEEANFPDAVERLESDIQLHNTRLQSMHDDARHAERLWAMGMLKTSEMSRSNLTLMNAEQTQSELQGKLDLLTEFTYPRTSMKLSYSRTNAARNIARTQLKNSLTATKARLSALAWERRVRIYEKYYKRALDSIEACTLRAPRDGQVIYANSWYERSRGITRIEEGKTVRREQRIFEIPHPNRLKVSVPVDEALVYRVHQGMDVVVLPAGYPDVEVRGQIRSVARYPRARSSHTPGIKDYWVDVELFPNEDQQQYLSPKADVTVRFVLEDRSDQLVIPRDSVTGIAGHNFVFVMEDNELVPRKVELGQANATQVCIQSGLNEGDQLVTSMTEQHQKRLQETLAKDLGVAIE